MEKTAPIEYSTVLFWDSGFRLPRPISTLGIFASSRLKRNQGNEIICPRLDKFEGIARFFQRPPELVTEPGFLVDIELVRTREFPGARKNRIMRVSQSSCRCLILRTKRCRRNARRKFRSDRTRKFVDFYSIEPLEH